MNRRDFLKSAFAGGAQLAAEELVVGANFMFCGREVLFI